jgi:prepilin-type N-terminal cleavage/methylation domain-containing protein
LKVLMSNTNQRGFTLVEVIIVMAISSALVVIAFVGQRSLRAQAQFDAAVDKIVATVADARNQALAGVNIVGSGDGTNGCAGGGAGAYVFAGVAWTADNALPGSPIKFDYYKGLPGSGAANGGCIFQTETINLPSTVQVNAANPPPTRGGRVLFVRNGTGSLAVCAVSNLTVDVRASFRDGACTAPAVAGTLTLNLRDTDGHTSQVIIDQSGLAKRQN